MSLSSLSPLEASGEMLSSVSLKLAQGRSPINAVESVSKDNVRTLQVVLADTAHLTTSQFVFEEDVSEARALPP